jgi:regulatory protein
LGRRDYALKELAGKLKEKGYPGYDIARTIDQLEEENLLNDARFAHSRARYRATVSKWGAARIRQELGHKGVAKGLIQEAVTALAEPAHHDFDESHDFQETATVLLRRRFGLWQQEAAPSDTSARQAWLNQQQKEKKKRVDFLLRRGFSLDEALKALEENRKDA